MEVPHVGAIMPVGMGAPVGDVAVAGVVISPHIDKSVRIEAESIDNSSQALWLVHKTLGRIFKISSRMDNILGRFVFKPEVTGIFSTPDSLFGTPFKEIAELTEYSKVVGFCPTTSADALGRTQIAVRNLDRLIKQDYPDVVMVQSDGLDIPSGCVNGWMHEMWETSSQAVPSGITTVTQETLSSVQADVVLRIMSAGLLAEAIATSVRAARISDLSTIYPALRLEENWGFGGRSLYKGLTYFTNFNQRGFRGNLTEQWINWFETRGEPRPISEMGPFVPTGPGDAPITKVTDATIARWNPLVKVDSKDRKIINFDKAKADFMIGELMKHKNRGWDNWTQKFLPSVESQLKSNRRLSGRQMYLLWQKYGDL